MKLILNEQRFGWSYALQCKVMVSTIQHEATAELRRTEIPLKTRVLTAVARWQTRFGQGGFV